MPAPARDFWRRRRGEQATEPAASEGKADMKNTVIALLSVLACSHSELDDVAMATIGAGGGTLRLADGTGLEVPHGALSHDTEITILRRLGSARLGSGVSAVGPVYEFLPDGTTFDVPIVVTLAFSPELTTGSEIRIMTAPTGTSAFTELPAEIVDGNHARASTLILSNILVAMRPSGCHGNSPCNDGNACTFNDRCVNGQCRGTPYTCDDGNVCTNNVCDGAGGCSFTPNSAPCNDDNLCTRNDTCANGACAGIAFTCDDGNVCTDDACNGSGCTFTPNHAPCDDGNACTSNDTCSGGVCGGSFSCCSPGPETNCSNGIDDDCDGLVDYADPDCVLQPCGADECSYGYLCFPDSYCHSHCEDGAPDYDESASDCGGADCPRCQAGQHCFSGFDCASGNCVNNICQ